MLISTALRIATVSALTALILTGCATSGKIPVEPKLPPLPADIKVCFEDEVPAPKPGPLTKGQAMDLIASLKLSEFSKTMCGKRLIAFYESFA
ncbi:o-spanin [Rhizobium phage Pasto]|uniref:O-spanin n=1 Tax=Rhizobium phage Pasto TaxID=2767575 RepID=A0A7S6R7Z9_9CAUD|nr:o-spanin [Rhizobium phage Pasto]